MSEKLSPALDPSSYVAMSAQLVAGVGDPLYLAKQTDELLSACQGGDYSVLIRHHNAIILSSQLSAHQAMQRAQQCSNPLEYKQWMQIAQDAQKMAESATRQVQELTNTQDKLKPYLQQTMQRALLIARSEVTEERVRQLFLKREAELRLKHDPLPTPTTQRLQTQAEMDAVRFADDWADFALPQGVYKEEETR